MAAVTMCSDFAIHLGSTYGGGNEDSGDLLQKTPGMYCCTQCPQPCSWPPPTHASAGDSWTLTGKSESNDTISCSKRDLLVIGKLMSYIFLY